MTVALVILAVAQTASILGFLRYLHGRDQRDATELQVLLNRIQDPPAAIAQTIAMEPVNDPGYQTEFSPEECAMTNGAGWPLGRMAWRRSRAGRAPAA